VVRRVVHITVQVLPNPFGPLGATLRYIFVEMIEVGFIKPVTFVGEGPKGDLDHRVHREAGDGGVAEIDEGRTDGAIPDSGLKEITEAVGALRAALGR